MEDIDHIDERAELGIFGSDRERWFVRSPDDDEKQNAKPASGLNSLFVKVEDNPRDQ